MYHVAAFFDVVEQIVEVGNEVVIARPERLVICLRTCRGVGVPRNLVVVGFKIFVVEVALCQLVDETVRHLTSIELRCAHLDIDTGQRFLKSLLVLEQVFLLNIGLRRYVEPIVARAEESCEP